MERNYRTFADIIDQQPKVRNIKPDEIENYLERIKADNYAPFAPENIGAYFLGNLARSDSTTDSIYGIRMDVTQQILATALYSGEDFAKYLAGAFEKLNAKADNLQKGYDSQGYKLKKSIKLLPEKIRRTVGFKGKYLDSYFYGTQEQNEIKRKRAVAGAYKHMADTIAELIKEFGNRSIEEIIELTELNHHFSGIMNGTKKDITFTDEGIRMYGTKVQQAIHRMWYAGIIEDTPNPLSERELFRDSIFDHNPQ